MPLEKEEPIEVIEDDEAKKITEDSIEQERKEPEQEDESEEDHEEEVVAKEDEPEEEEERKTSLAAERRRERKRRQREHMERDKATIAEQGATIKELVSRLAAVESSQQAMRLTAVDNSIAKQKEQIERIKGYMANTDDNNIRAELQDKLFDEKIRLRDLEAAKEAASRAVKDPRKGNIDPYSQDKERLLHRWVAQNPWFDPNGRGVDSKIAIAVDQALTEEGIFRPHTQAYYDELNERLREQLPHRYDVERKVRRSPPMTSSRGDVNRVEGTVKLGKNQFRLSPERKEALIQAGVYGTPEQDRYIRSYMEHDKANGLR